MPLAAITSLTLWHTTQFLAEYKVNVFRERELVAIPLPYYFDVETIHKTLTSLIL